MNTFDILTNYYYHSEVSMKKEYPRYTLRVSNETLFKLAFVSDFRRTAKLNML